MVLLNPSSIERYNHLKYISFVLFFFGATPQTPGSASLSFGSNEIFYEAEQRFLLLFLEKEDAISRVVLLGPMKSSVKKHSIIFHRKVKCQQLLVRRHRCGMVSFKAELHNCSFSYNSLSSFVVKHGEDRLTWNKLYETDRFALRKRSSVIFRHLFFFLL
jgi:hypothetical protein